MVTADEVPRATMSHSTQKKPKAHLPLAAYPTRSPPYVRPITAPRLSRRLNLSVQMKLERNSPIMSAQLRPPHHPDPISPRSSALIGSLPALFSGERKES